MGSSFSSRNDGRFSTNVVNSRGQVMVCVQSLLPDMGDPDASVDCRLERGILTITITPRVGPMVADAQCD